MKRNKHKQKGTVLVELAVVLPVFVLILVGTVEFGLIMHNYLILQNATREGARFAAVGNSSAAIQQRVRDFSFELDNGNLDVQVTNAQGDRGSSVTVQASYPIPLITPLMSSLTGTSSLALRTQAVMRLE